MSVPIRFALPLILSAIAILVGCGGGSGVARTAPPPSGGFSAADLNGTYVFSVTGSDSLGDFMAMAGTVTADGSGNLTGGTFDVNNPNGLGLAQAISIGARSAYTVSSDGRGSLTFNTSAGTFSFDFVLTSNAGGLITEFDSGGSGSGTLNLQSTVTQADVAGSYAFNFSGTAGVSTAVCGIASTGSIVPLANVGAFTLDANGNITTGVEDFNNNCSSTNGTNLTITGGSISLAAIPGTATITSTAATYNFDVYPVSKTNLKFIETDTVTVMTGNAFSQSPGITAGANVFTLAGFDMVGGGPFTAAGFITTDGNGTVTAGVEDINDQGTASTVTNLTGSYTPFSGGPRSTLTLSGFVNGAGGAACSSCQFALYPSTGGLQMMEVDNGGMTNGVAYPQTATTLASSQGYGMNLAGINRMEEDDIAEFTNNNGSFSGIIDFNDQGSTNFDQKFSSTYTPDSTVAGRGVVTPGTNAFNLVTYVVNASTTVFVETDTNQIGLGSFMEQNSSATANAAVAHLAVLRAATARVNALKPHAK